MRLIDADEMAANESEAYMSAQVKIESPITLGINSCVHRKIQQLIEDTPTIDPESRRPVAQWISVKDRLPEIDGNVLVIVNGRPHKNITLESAYELAEFSPSEGWILEMWPEWETPDITHWMPLPEPPKEET